MEMKDTLSSCSDLDDQEMQQMLKRAKILKGSCLSSLSALKSTFTLKLEQGITKSEFERAFSHIFGEDVDTFTRTVLKTQFENFFTSVLIKPSSLDGTYARKDFRAYTGIEPQPFKEEILKLFDFIEDYMLKTIIYVQTIQKRLNKRKLQIQECTVQNASDASSGEKDVSLENDQGLENQSNTSGDESSRSRNECNDKSTFGDDTDINPTYDTEPMIEVQYTVEHNVFVVDTQRSEQSECIINTCVVEKVDSNVIPDSPDMYDNEIQNDHNAVECGDERVALANLIANLKRDIDENKMIQKQLKKANASLTQELS
ncbi:hypothetical protein Tco_1435171 [Tanacetum coccineum]